MYQDAEREPTQTRVLVGAFTLVSDDATAANQQKAFSGFLFA